LKEKLYSPDGRTFAGVNSTPIFAKDLYKILKKPTNKVKFGNFLDQN